MPGYETGIVRLTTRSGELAGLGVLVNRTAVVTCAHVVNKALDRPLTEQRRPDDSVEVAVRFPYLDGGVVRYGTVAAWVAPPLSGPGMDIAGLQLGEEAPAGVAPARLARGRPTPGEVGRVLGYPGEPRRVTPVFVDLDLKGELGQGLIQVESRVGQTFKAQPGFSGSPVWRDGTGEVVGLLHATALTDTDERDAYVVSATAVAEAWEDTFDYMLVAPNPYRGLEPFTVDHAELFFGRDYDIEQLRERVTAQPVTVVFGPSGVGKSSLVQAGLVPRLQRDGQWAVAVVRPGQDPWQRLAIGLLLAEQAAGAGDTSLSARLPRDVVERRVRELRSDGLEPLGRYLRSRDRSLLVIVDQFEEALSAGGPDADLLDLLLPGPGRASPAARVVLTLRADYLPSLTAIPGLGPRLDQRLFPLSPLSPEQVRAAVHGPADALGVGFEDGLVDEIAKDTASGSLPLLQFMLTRLWGTQRRRRLTFSGYRGMGGVEAALHQFAEQQMAALDPSGRAVVERVLLRLVHTPAGDVPLTTRQRVYQADLEPEEWSAVEHLSELRLVVTGTDLDGRPYGELAHEALITSWRRLAQLVADNAQFLGWLASVRRRAQDGDPLPDSRLEDARRWLEQRARDIPVPVQQFIATSEAAAAARRSQEAQAHIAEAAREKAQQVAESLRLASEAREATQTEPETAFLVAWEALLRDRNELTDAVFREALERLPASVKILLSTDDASIAVRFLDPRTVVAVTKCWVDDGVVAEVRLLGLEAEKLAAFQVAGDGSLAVAVPPAGGRLLTYRSGVLRRYDRRGVLLGELALPDAPADRGSQWCDITFADDGTTLVHDQHMGWLIHPDQFTVERTFRFGWFPGAPEPFGGHPRLASVFRATLDPKGSFVVTESSDGARVWDTAGSGVVPLEGEEGTASARVLADGTVVAGGMYGGGGTWDRAGSRRTSFREEAQLDLFITAVDPSGKYFASAVTGDGMVEVRDATGEPVTQLKGPDGLSSRSAAFSPGGRLLATGWDDRVCRIWDWRAQDEPVLLHGHTGAVREVAFHPTDPEVLITGDNQEVRLWRLSGAILPQLRGHAARIRVLEPIPAGVVISADSGTTRAWSAAGEPFDLGGQFAGMTTSPSGGRTFVVTIDEHGIGRVWCIADDLPTEPCGWFAVRPGQESARATVAADGQHVLLQDGDSVTMWSAGDEAVADVIGDRPPGAGGRGRVVGARFRPDGRSFVVAAQGGGVWIWTVSGRLVATFVTDYGAADRTFDLDSDPQGELIATAVRNSVGLWTWEGESVGQLAVAGYKVRRVAFSPDGERIVTVCDNPGGATPVLAELWSREGDRIAILHWISTYLGVEPIFDVGGRYILIPGATGLSVVGWDGERLARLAGPRGTGLVDAARTRDGELVAALFDDGVVRIWSFSERRRTTSLQVGRASRIAFQADGRELLAGMPSGDIIRHPLDVADLFAPAMKRVARFLSPGELERFGIDSSLLGSRSRQG